MRHEFEYDVFLSHNSDDKPAVETMGAKLRTDGFRPFLDKWHLVPGKPWQTALADALRESECVAIFFGPSGEGAWHHEEMQVALNRAVRTRDDYRVIPVLLPGSSPSQLDGFLELRTWVDFRSGLDDEAAYGRLVAAIKGEAPVAGDARHELPDEPRPYRGLDRFEGAQHDFFFGRDEEVRRLVDRLEDDRFVAVVGASGSGKSSLVRAGLCTDVAEQIAPGIRRWRRIAFVPSSDPLRQLATHLVAHLPEAERPALVRGFLDDFRAHRTGLITALATLFPSPELPVLLLVDQFEELFTHRPGIRERQGEWHRNTACFGANLREAFEAGADWLRTIITLRADFVDRFVSEDFPDYRELLERRQFWLGEMNDDDLREAIVRPAERRGAYFEKGLVQAIRRDMRGQTGALPLLEEALEALWIRRRGPWLTHDAYTECGGVGGALAAKADRIYESLSEEDRILARRLFLGLIQLGEGTRDTRRRAALSTLLPARVDRDRLQSIIGRFSSAQTRLITISSDESAEITHEALIYHWERIVNWLDESRDALRLQRRLEEAARHWDEQGRPDGILWRSPDLDLLRAVVKREGESLTQLQIEFYQASEQAEAAQAAEQERQRRTLQRRLRFAVTACVAASVLAVVAMTWFRVAQERRVEAERTVGRSLLYGIGVSDGPIGDVEQEALWDLAQSASENTRWTFVERALGPARHLQLDRRTDVAIRAAVGLNLARRKKVIGLIVSKLEDPSVAWKIRRTCLLAGVSLRAGDDNLRFARLAANATVEMIAKTLREEASDSVSTPTMVRRLAEAFGAVAGNLEERDAAENASEIAHAIVDRSGNVINDRWLREFAVSFRAIAAWLNEEDALVVATTIAEKLRGAPDVTSGQEMQEALKVVATRLNDVDAPTVAERILQSIGRTSDAEDRKARHQAFLTVAGNLNESGARSLADQIVHELTESPFGYGALTDAFQVVGRKLDHDGALSVVAKIGEAIGELRRSSPSSSRALLSLAEVFQEAAGRLHDDSMKKRTAAAIAGKIDEATARARRSYDLGNLARAFRIVAHNMDDEDAAKISLAIAKKIVSAFANDSPPVRPTADQLRSSPLSDGLEAVAEQLHDEALVSILDQMAVVTENSQHYRCYRVRTYARVFQAVADRMTHEDASKSATRLAAMIVSPRDMEEARYLAEAFQAIHRRLNPDQAAVKASEVVSMLVDARVGYGDDHWHMAEAARAVAEIVDGDDAVSVANMILRAASMSDGTTLLDFGDAFQTLAANLPAPAALQVANAIRESADKLPQRVFRRLAQGVGSVGRNLSREDAFDLARKIVSDYATSPNYYVQEVLTEDLFRGIAQKLSEEQSASIANDIEDRISGEPTSGKTVTGFANMAEALAGKLRPVDAQKLASALAVVVVAELQDASPNLETVCQAFQRITESLPADEANTVASAIAARILKDAEETADLESLAIIAQAFEAVDQHLADDQAAKTAFALVKGAVESKPNTPWNIQRDLTVVVNALADRLDDDLALALAGKLLETEKRFELTGAVMTLTRTLAKNRLIELAKYPNCTGPLEEVVLIEFGRRMEPAQDFQHVWDTVRSLAETNSPLYEASQQPAVRPSI